MKRTKSNLSLPFLLAVLCQSSVGLFLTSDRVLFSCREALIGGGLAAAVVWLCLMGLATLDVPRIFSSNGNWIGTLWKAALVAGLLLGMGDTIWQMVRLCQSWFADQTAWLILLIACLLLLRPTISTLGRCAYAIVALAVICAALALLGVGGQMQWHQLSNEPIRVAGVQSAAGILFCFIPEYLALPLTVDARRGAAVPLWLFAVQATVALVAETIFGFDAAQGRYPAIELFRAWTIGGFSRFDTFLAGLWLLLAFFRILLLETLLANTFAAVIKKPASERCG